MAVMVDRGSTTVEARVDKSLNLMVHRIKPVANSDADVEVREPELTIRWFTATYRRPALQS